MKAIFRNFLLTLRRFRLASALNVVGLSVAFATFIIIMIQVRYERTFDTAYGKPGRIFRIESTLVQTEANRASHQSYTPFCARPLIGMILPSVPQIASYTVMYGPRLFFRVSRNSSSTSTPSATSSSIHPAGSN